MGSRMILTKNGHKGLLCPHPEAIYMYITKILKHFLLRNRLVNQSQILYEDSIGSGTDVYINNPGHMTKMADMPIYGKTLKNLLRNWFTDFNETWLEALMTYV